MADKPKILIVDDIAEYAMAFEMYLPEGAESLCASSADEAKTLLAANAPVDLAVVDVRLDGERDGDTSGMELLSWMRETYPRMPVVMVSAYQTFDSSRLLTDVQDELCATMITELAENIYNDTVAKW